MVAQSGLRSAWLEICREYLLEPSFLQSPRVLGIGWLHVAIPDGYPKKEYLDAVVSDRPVYLDAFDLHSSWLNSAALKELGITRDTPDPIGGRIVRDANGDATGHLLETACSNLVWPLLNAVDAATTDRFLAACNEAYNSTGVTSAVDMALTEDALEAMQRAEKDGSLKMRIVGHWFMNRQPDFKDELKQVDRAKELAESTKNSEMVRVRGIKIIVDGVIDGCTAALLQPYTNGNNEDPIWDAESLERMVVYADSLDLQIALHAIGDRAIRIALDALEKAKKVNGTSGKRHRIEHLEYCDEKDIVRLAPLGVTASMQPVVSCVRISGTLDSILTLIYFNSVPCFALLAYLAPLYSQHVDPCLISTWLANLGPERGAKGFAWRAFLDAGTTLVFGTDTPTAPHAALPNMYIANTRKSPGDPTVEPHGVHNALPLDQAVRHATRDSAWASFLEDKVGCLREGLWGDVVVLDKNVFEGTAEGLLSARVVGTWLGGKEVWRSEG